MSDTPSKLPALRNPAPKKTSAPEDPDRRVVLRVGSAVMIAGAAGLGTYTFYDRDKPIRSRRDPDRIIADHRIKVPPTTPKMIIARGKDPKKNTEAALARIGGMKLFVQKGDVVLIKPNVGWNRRPAQAADTNPHVVGAVVRACKEAGAKEIWVTDCPVNNPERCFKRSGILDAVREAGGRVILPSRSRFVMVRIPGKLGRWPVLEPFVKATKLINIPVAKHHSLTHATVGMKNWYGILGGQRNRLHQRIDDSIAELAALMRPTLTVVDATRLLLRNGPTGGSLADVKIENALAVSIDPIAADAWGAELIGAELDKLSWLIKGQQKKLGVIDYKSLNPIEIKV